MTVNAWCNSNKICKNFPIPTEVFEKNYFIQEDRGTNSCCRNTCSRCYQIKWFYSVADTENHLKTLLWEGDGFVLLYKRLENGSFKWPREESELKPFTWQQFRWLLEGLQVEQKQSIHTATRGDFC